MAEVPGNSVEADEFSTALEWCQLNRIGENVSEKLDYVPGEFTVERYIRGKWASDKCESLI